MLNIKNQFDEIIGRVEYIEGDALDIVCESGTNKILKIKSHSNSDYTVIKTSSIVKELYDIDGNKYYPGASYEDTIKDEMDLYVVDDNMSHGGYCLVRVFKVCAQRMKQYDVPKCIPLTTFICKDTVTSYDFLCAKNGFLYQIYSRTSYGFTCKTSVNEVIGCTAYDSSAIRTRDELYNFNYTDPCLINYPHDIPNDQMTNFNIYILEGRRVILDSPDGKSIKRIKMIDKYGKKIEVKDLSLVITKPPIHKHLYWTLDGFLGNLTLSINPIEGNYWKSGEWDYEDYKLGKSIPLHRGVYTSLSVVQNSIFIRCKDSSSLFGYNVSFTTDQMSRITFNP